MFSIFAIWQNKRCFVPEESAFTQQAQKGTMEFEWDVIYIRQKKKREMCCFRKALALGVCGGIAFES